MLMIALKPPRMLDTSLQVDSHPLITCYGAYTVDCLEASWDTYITHPSKGLRNTEVWAIKKYLL